MSQQLLRHTKVCDGGAYDGSSPAARWADGCWWHDDDDDDDDFYWHDDDAKVIYVMNTGVTTATVIYIVYTSFVKIDWTYDVYVKLPRRGICSRGGASDVLKTINKMIMMSAATTRAAVKADVMTTASTTATSLMAAT